MPSSTKWIIGPLGLTDLDGQATMTVLSEDLILRDGRVARAAAEYRP